MEVSTIEAVNKLGNVRAVVDPIEVRVRNNDKITLAAALRQVWIERMAIIGRPSEAVLAQFLKQLESSDVDVLVNMVKFALRTASRSYRYVMSRFQFMVRAAKCIRLFWLGARFRFSDKMQRLMLQWRRDEDEARRKLLSRSRTKSKGAKGAEGTTSVAGQPARGGTERSDDNDNDDDDFALQQFISLQAPVELKRRVMLRQYKILAHAFRLRWREWRAKMAQYEHDRKQILSGGASSLGRKSHRHTADQEAAKQQALSLLTKPEEPKLHWFEQLSALSASERYQMCLEYQLRKSLTHTSGAGGSNEEGADDGWIALALGAVARHARQIEERTIAAANAVGVGADSGGGGGSAGGDGHYPRARVPIVSYLPNYHNVRSKVMDATNALSNDGSSVVRRGRSDSTVASGDLAAEPAVSSTVLTATRMIDLKKELPTLQHFKSEGWNVPPRPSGRLAASDQHTRRSQLTSSHTRPSETPSVAQLDPFAKSLVLRGVLRPPTRPARGARSSSAIFQQRSELMSKASVEISTSYRHASTEALMKSERMRAMVLQRSVSSLR